MYADCSTSHAPSDVLSTEVRVALSPDVAYERLRAARSQDSARQLATRLVTVLLVIGTIVPTMATGRVTIGLVAWSSVVWGFVVVIQVAVALALIASASRRAVRLVDALDLWFAGHLPSSLWLLCGAVVIARSDPAADPLPVVLLGAIIPAWWTAVIVAAFCRRVLDLPPDAARIRAASHFMVTWSIVFSYMAWASGGWFQIVDAALRLFRR